MFFSIPFSHLFKKFKPNEKITEYKLILSELLGGGCGFILSLSLYSIESSLNINVYFYIYALLIIILSVLLLFFGIFDLEHFEIPAKLANYSVAFFLIVSIFVSILKVILGDDLTFQSVDDFAPIGNIENYSLFLINYGVVYLLVYLTKEEGMGKGDADILGMMGLFLSLKSNVMLLLFVPIVGGVIALFIIILIKKYKDVRIPLVPILTITFLFMLGFSDVLFDNIFI